MALELDVKNDRFGTLVPNAYAKLAYFRWSDADMKAMATFSVFASAQALADGKEVIYNVEIDVTDMFSNIQADLYKECKKRSEFTEAKDV